HRSTSWARTGAGASRLRRLGLEGQHDRDGSGGPERGGIDGTRIAIVLLVVTWDFPRFQRTAADGPSGLQARLLEVHSRRRQLSRVFFSLREPPEGFTHYREG